MKMKIRLIKDIHTEGVFIPKFTIVDVDDPYSQGSCRFKIGNGAVFNMVEGIDYEDAGSEPPSVKIANKEREINSNVLVKTNSKLVFGNETIEKNKVLNVTKDKECGGYIFIMPSGTKLHLVDGRDCDLMDDKHELNDAKENKRTTGTSADASHYIKGRLEPIEVMQRLLTKEQFIGFLAGNMIKYKLRAGMKGNKEIDLNKAAQYEMWVGLAEDDIVIDPLKHAFKPNE
jgi:hypothetical protein